MFGQTLFAWREQSNRGEATEGEYRPYKCYVEKQQLPVVVCTTSFRIEGMMHITYHHRALDILNGPEEFIPMTSVKLYSIATNELLAEQAFVAISKKQLVLLYETGKPVPPPSHAEQEGEEGFDRPAEPEAAAGAGPDGAAPQSTDG